MRSSGKRVLRRLSVAALLLPLAGGDLLPHSETAGSALLGVTGSVHAAVAAPSGLPELHLDAVACAQAAPCAACLRHFVPRVLGETGPVARHLDRPGALLLPVAPLPRPAAAAPTFSGRGPPAA